MNNHKKLCSVLLLAGLTVASKGAWSQETVNWTNWTDLNNGNFNGSNTTISTSQVIAGTILTNPDAGSSSSFTAWDGVAVSLNNGSTLDNIPAQNSLGYRIDDPGTHTFNLSSPVDAFYVIATSIGAPNITQRFDVTDVNGNALNLTIVGTAADLSRNCAVESNGTVVSGNEANCVVKVSLPRQTTFNVNILETENFSVMNFGIPAEPTGSVTRSVPTLSNGSLLLLLSAVAYLTLKKQRRLNNNTKI